MLISRELARVMRDSGVRNISVSLDGATAEVHDEIRGVAGGFEKTVSGINALVAAGCHPELILTLQRSNLDQLTDFLRLASQLGAGNVKLNVVQPMLRGSALEEEGETLSIAELLDLAQWLRSGQVEQGGMPVNLDLPPAFRPLGAIVSGADSGLCDILHILGVIPDGKYALCGIGQHVDALVMGDVISASLDDVWSRNPVLCALRDGLPAQLKGVCASCLMKGACRGNCIAVNFQGNNDLFAPFWFCQRAYEQGRFPATRLKGGGTRTAWPEQPIRL